MAKHLNWFAVENFEPWKAAKGEQWGGICAATWRLGRQSLGAGDAVKACEHFEAAATAPHDLGESGRCLARPRRHPLLAQFAGG